jgi:phage recombination protein Bet
MAVDSKALAPYQQFDNQQLDIIKKTVAASLNKDQFLLFIEVCKHYRLNPMARQIYGFNDNKGRMVVQTSIDGFRLMAERTKLYGGQIGPEWCGPDGVWKDVWLEKEPPAAARVGIIRRDFDKPMWGVARYSSYAGTSPNWSKMPEVMISKCAESLAFRKAFPAEMGGLYTSDEMEQAADEMRMPSYAIQEVEGEAAVVMITKHQIAILQKLCEKLNKPMYHKTEEMTAEEATKRIQELQEEVNSTPEPINQGQIVTIQKLCEKMERAELPGISELTREDAARVIRDLNDALRAHNAAKASKPAQPVQQPAAPKQEQPEAKQPISKEAYEARRLAIYERTKELKLFVVSEKATENVQAFLKFVTPIINANVTSMEHLTPSRLDAIETYINAKDVA